MLTGNADENWEPFVKNPTFAIDTMPGPICRLQGEILIRFVPIDGGAASAVIESDSLVHKSWTDSESKNLSY